MLYFSTFTTQNFLESERWYTENPMNDRRSIQDIIPPARSKPRRSVVQPAGESEGSRLPPRPPRSKEGAGAFALFGVAAGVILIIVAAFILVSTVFHRAEVTVQLKSFSVPVSTSLTASVGGPLTFSIKSAESSAERTVASSGTESVEEHASGTITVFNEYSTASQRLITNTRFEAENGRIYRIKSPVVVPGYRLEGGQKVPGSIKVTVYADEPGDAYNLPSADFTIPGLKGTEQYQSMYARSEGPLSGGFVGERAFVEKDVRDAAMRELRLETENMVRAQFLSALVDTEIYFPETLTIVFIEGPDRPVPNGAVVSVTARAEAPIFEESAVADALAQEANVPFEGALTLKNADDLAITASSSEDSVTVSVSGEAVLVGVLDGPRLRGDLSGKDRRSVGSVLASYPEVEDMTVSVYPFWRGTLPSEVDRIRISVAE